MRFNRIKSTIPGTLPEDRPVTFADSQATDTSVSGILPVPLPTDKLLRRVDIIFQCSTPKSPNGLLLAQAKEVVVNEDDSRRRISPRRHPVTAAHRVTQQSQDKCPNNASPPVAQKQKRASKQATKLHRLPLQLQLRL